METNTLEPRGADIRNELEFAPSDSTLPMFRYSVLNI